MFVYRRFESTMMMVMGYVFMLLGAALLVPGFIAMGLGESYGPFLSIVPFLMLMGALLIVLFRQDDSFKPIQGLLLVLVVWVVVFVVGMIPYVILGMSPLDSMFESVSGFTTTGSTIMSDIESWPMSLLVWRSMTQWMGGILVIIIFLYILPMVSTGRTVFSNELSGSGSSEYTIRMGRAARSFILVYAFLSLLNYLLIVACGVEWLEALCMVFSTISTGGLMCTQDSLSSYSVWVEVVTILFMFLGGTNFYLHYTALVKRTFKPYRTNSEFRTNVLWFLGISVIIFVMLLISEQNLDLDHVMSEYKLFIDVGFTVVSIGTSTGFTVTDYGLFPAQCIIMLMLVGFIGASAGSTAGGIKLGRIHIIYQSIRTRMARTVSPSMVTRVKVDKDTLDHDMVLSAFSVMVMFIGTLLVGAILIMMCGYDIVDSVGLAIASLGNVGVAFGNFGPSGDMSVLEEQVKVLMMILMWVGRLEVITALVFFTPTFWREVMADHRANRRENASRRQKS